MVFVHVHACVRVTHHGPTQVICGKGENQRGDMFTRRLIGGLAWVWFIASLVSLVTAINKRQMWIVKIEASFLGSWLLISLLSTRSNMPPPPLSSMSPLTPRLHIPYCLHILHMHACMHAYLPTCIHKYIHACMHTFPHTTYEHTCVHTNIHACIWTSRGG